MAKLAVLLVLVSAVVGTAVTAADAPANATPPPDVAAYASSLPIGTVAPAFNVMEVRSGSVLCFL
ncbi:MAG: hypothetical protein ACUVTZ_12000 [Armatimonadota bacterium]